MKKILPFFLLVLLLASCQKDPDMSKLSDDFVVFTDYSKDAKFDSFTTFYIPDSVMVIGNSEKAEFWSAAEADDIVTTLVSGMQGRGYTRTTDKANADLGIQVSFIKNVNYFTNYTDNSYWWWGYPGYNWWYGYWGTGWNGWYYPYPIVYSYSVGSLLVEIVNLKAAQSTSADTKLPVLWTAYMTGLLSGSDKVNIKLSTRAIEQAFVQSPYLKK
ncbi:DUF4136 domain-containing protein [Parabacteroides sp. AM08-6]|uniref:DUF4136 domain-containing protein n=1 Tax=Parabacteroides sp. AM08-6 TaxID=2292053 RepID=UPI000EFE3C89|nr:DUF4136 domain-containing protein [Parabacteroides sp. AM08-6]RHJ83250.1 DUF4136 domain-containing protein [Parabacteroides sp. AM08-6]